MPITRSTWQEFTHAPLVPIALALSSGIVLDRWVNVPAFPALIVAVICLAAMRFTPVGYHRWFLATAFAALGAAYHHHTRDDSGENDLARHIRTEPQLLRVRGTLQDDPVPQTRSIQDALEPIHRTEREVVLVDVQQLFLNATWQPIHGTLCVTVEKPFTREAEAAKPLQTGDEIEAFGMVWFPGPPKNPGERDYANSLRDQNIRGEMHLTDPAAMQKLSDAKFSLPLALTWLRRSANQTIREHLHPREAATASALLLGDGSALERSEWDAYVRTGVVHALAISGQHLAVLAGFLWFALRALRISPRSRAIGVLVIVVGYTLLTGLRPSGVRACIMVASLSLGYCLRRPIMPANSFALGWIAVIVLNPTDIFSLGCQLSFLSVFVLMFGLGPLFTPAPLSPVEKLLAESRSPTEKALRWALQCLWQGFLVNLLITLVNMPLLIRDQNIVSPASIIIGPAIIFFTSIALVLGFLMLFTGPTVLLPALFAWPVGWSLQLCHVVVTWGEKFPAGVIYAPSPPGWWAPL
jgi:competence protein ComEC